MPRVHRGATGPTEGPARLRTCPVAAQRPLVGRARPSGSPTGTQPLRLTHPPPSSPFFPRKLFVADIADTPGWRTGLLFLLFAVISVSVGGRDAGVRGAATGANVGFHAPARPTHPEPQPAAPPLLQVFLEHITEWLEHKWSQRRGHARSNGLLTMLTFIKQELFLLGLISMLLTAVQDPMLRIWWVFAERAGQRAQQQQRWCGGCCQASSARARPRSHSPRRRSAAAKFVEMAGCKALGAATWLARVAPHRFRLIWLLTHRPYALAPCLPLAP
jgi:hypothetical protein